jgi:hypothetical protein
MTKIEKELQQLRAQNYALYTAVRLLLKDRQDLREPLLEVAESASDARKYAEWDCLDTLASFCGREELQFDATDADASPSANDSGNLREG